MEKKQPYTFELIDGNLDSVSQEAYAALQDAITRVVSESGAQSFRIQSESSEAVAADRTVRTLFVNDIVTP